METLCRGWAGAATGLLALSWTWMYTAALPEQVRRARREEIRSDLHDQMVQYRMEGGSLAGTAIDVLRRMSSGAWDDVWWSLPQIPSILAGHLWHVRCRRPVTANACTAQHQHTYCKQNREPAWGGRLSPNQSV